MKTKDPKGWHSRGYLPHFDGGENCQFITLHLGDAMPSKVVEKWKRQLERETEEAAGIILTKRIEKYLDQGYGSCWLRKPEIAETVQGSLLYFDAVRYKLISWVIMPNHTHFLIRPAAGNSLSSIMKNHESYTAHQCNKILKRTGQFWQFDYFDRYIRDFDHFEDTIRYIENNPVKAGLCQKPSDWKYGSAFSRSADG